MTARKKTAAAKAPAVDEGASYRVILARKVKLGETWLQPRNDVVVKGHILVALGDAVASYEPAEDV